MTIRERAREFVARLRQHDIRAHDVSVGAAGDQYFVCFFSDQRIRDSYFVSMDEDEAALLRDMLTDTIRDHSAKPLSDDDLPQWEVDFLDREQRQKDLEAFARDVLGMCNATDQPSVPPQRRHILETDLIRAAAARHLGEEAT